MNAIEVELLTKTIRVGFRATPRTVLKDVSFTVGEGRLVGFVGPNGAGKSTTLRHVIGASRPSSGSVRVFGLDPARRATRSTFGYLPDLPALPRHLDAAETLTLFAALAGQPVDLGLLDRVGLSAQSTTPTRSFSKGMLTRLALAQALIGSPRLLILDEPMSGLDPIGRRAVRQILREEHAAGRTILFSSHVLSDVEALCDHVVVINNGNVVFNGSVTDAIGGSTQGKLIHVDGTTRVEEVKPFGPVTRSGDEWVVSVTGADAFDVVNTMRARGLVVHEVRRDTASMEDRVIELMKSAPTGQA